MRSAVGLAILLAVSVLPNASAQGEPLCIITITPSPDFRVVQMDVDLILTAEELDAIARAADADGDGTITPAEARAYEANATQSLAIDELGTRKLYVDQWPATAVVGQLLFGFERPFGALQSPPAESRKVREIRSYRLSDVYEQQDWHRLTGGSEAHPYSRPVIEAVVISAPPGWVVWDANGKEYKRSSVQITGFDTQSNYRIMFAKEGVDPYPRGAGFEGVFALLAVITVAFVVARSRRRS